MNKNSVLCRFLEEHPQNWREMLHSNFGIKIKDEGDYAIFNYSFDCDFADPIVQEARGIIIDTVKREVVCWPFRKFGNHHESYADDIDWEHARVLEKVDGSIVKLWFDLKLDQWRFSTNSMIDAEKAPMSETATQSFASLIRSADNYGQIPFDSLDRNCTYIFELVSPQTQVVIPYDTTALYHIGTRHNLTGQETEADIGIQKPKSYPISSMQECIEAAVALNRKAGDFVGAEGFVVVDSRWNRVKVKSPDYIVRHRLMMKKSLNKRECISMLLEESKDIDAICDAHPELIPLVKYYDYQLANLRYLCDQMGMLSRRLYEEYGGDRAAVCKVIGKHRLAWVGFKSIDPNRRDVKKGSELLKELQLERLCKLIPDYQEEDLSLLFLQQKTE